ncbi:MAG TPA: hypothetical protein VNJ02_09540 [Vicinamibacterales bacterium]|nr:hypothetical protein [Vicinamibacterales bacterium]
MTLTNPAASSRPTTTPIAVLLFGLIDAARAISAPASLRRSHPGLDVVVDVQLQMAFEFRRQLALGSSGGELARQAEQRRA